MKNPYKIFVKDIDFHSWPASNRRQTPEGPARHSRWERRWGNGLSAQHYGIQAHFSITPSTGLVPLRESKIGDIPADADRLLASLLPSPSPVPGLSVIIPSYERPALLRQCLLSLASQRFSGVPLEVIVVNDGGASMDTDALRGVFPGVRLLGQTNAGPAAARNTGAEAARYDWLAFVDDDCFVDSCWSVALVRALAEHPDGLIGGHTVNALSKNPYSIASQCVINALCRWLNRDPLNGVFVPSNNIACSRVGFLAIGGFNTAYRTAEDRDLCDRWRRAGGRVLQVSSAQAAHAHALDHRGFWQLHIAYGKGSRTFHQSRQREGMAPQKAGLSFLIELAREVFRQCSSRRQVIKVMLLVIESQLAVLAASYSTKRRSRPCSLDATPNVS